MTILGLSIDDTKRSTSVVNLKYAAEGDNDEASTLGCIFDAVATGMAERKMLPLLPSAQDTL